MNVLSVRGLCKRYGSFALRDVSFDVAPGSITGFIGRNGAGKTTTLKSLLDFVHPDAGEALFFGRPLSADEFGVKQAVGFASGGFGFYPLKRLRTVTDVTRRFYPSWDETAYRRYLALFALDENKRVKELSEGMKVKYALALALSHRARLLVLDEPTNDLDAETLELLGGEEMLGRRAVTPEVAAKVKGIIQRTLDYAAEHNLDIMGANPAPDNIAGGLTTIEEKALGNIQKIGRKAPVIGCLDKAESPTGPGLWFMDSSSAAAEMVTLCAASGFVAHFFPTGQGNIIGNPILPVIKLSANPRTVRTMNEHIDVDVSGILRREINMDQAGDMLLDMLFHTCNGRNTSAEALGHREFIMTRLYESA